MEDLYLPVGLCNVLTSTAPLRQHPSQFPHLETLIQSSSGTTTTTDLLLHLRITTERFGFPGLLRAFAFAPATSHSHDGLAVLLTAAGWQGSFKTSSNMSNVTTSTIGKRPTRLVQGESAQRIQVWVRRILTTRNIYSRRVTWAVITLQRWARGCVCRSRIMPLRHEFARRTAIMMYDGSYRNMPLKIVAFIRRPNIAAIHMQCWWRCLCAISLLKSKKATTKVIMLQRVYRGHLGRRYATERKVAKQREGIEKVSAIKIQKVWRGWLARRRIVENKASLQTQCLQQRLLKERSTRTERVNKEVEALRAAICVKRDVWERRMVLATVLGANTGDVNERVMQVFSATEQEHPMVAINQTNATSAASMMGDESEVLSWATGSFQYRAPQELRAGTQMALRVTESLPQVRCPARSLKAVRARAVNLAMSRMLSKPKPHAYLEE